MYYQKTKLYPEKWHFRVAGKLYAFIVYCIMEQQVKNVPQAKTPLNLSYNLYYGSTFFRTVCRPQ